MGLRSESVYRRVAIWTAFILLTCGLIHAQDTQFLPEIDTHFAVDTRVRLFLQAKEDREGGDPEQFTFGPNVQLYLKPWLKLKHMTTFDIDDIKRRMVVVESGYRIIIGPNAPNENRAIESVTFHLPIMWSILLTDRNRADLNWQKDTFTWRFRNKLTAERTVSISSYHLIPYVAAEPFYENKYNKWSTIDLYAGCQFPMGRTVQFDVYYEHENDTGTRPNRQNNYVGLSLSLYFFSARAAPTP